MENTQEELEKLREQEILSSYDKEDKVISSKEAWDLLEEERSKPRVKLMSKIPTLDNYLEGFRQGDLVVVSGVTKGGKTTFCQTLTHNFAEQEIPCLWFSYEMSPLEFMEKFGETLPFFSLPSKLKGNSLEWLEERIVESMAKYGTKIVFIDHLHFLIDMAFLGKGGGGNTSLLIGGIMRELKKIALYRGITIILISHTTKIKFDAEPNLSDIRDSSFISQEADTVLMIWRNKLKEMRNPLDFTEERKAQKETMADAMMAVLANRRTGKNGMIGLDLKKGRFYENTNNYSE